jgi:hypothetical protein
MKVKRFCAVAVAFAAIVAMAMPAGASSWFSNMSYSYTSTSGDPIANGCSVAPGTGKVVPKSVVVQGRRSLYMDFTSVSTHCGSIGWTIDVSAPAAQVLTLGAHPFVEKPNTEPANGWFLVLSSSLTGHLCNGDAHGVITIKRWHTDHRMLDLYGADIAFTYQCVGSSASISGEVAWGS